MVTSQISGFGFTATAPTVTQTADSGAFLQALQGEISQTADITAVQSDETMTFTPEFLEKLMNFVTKLLEEQSGGDMDLARKIIEELLKKLKGDDEEDEDKTALQNDESKIGEPEKGKNVGTQDVPEGLLEIIKAMLENMQEEMKEHGTKLSLKTDVSIIAGAGKISIDGSENGTITEFIPVDAQNVQAQKFSNASEQETPLQNGTDVKTQQVTDVMQQSSEEIGQQVLFEVKEPLKTQVQTVPDVTATFSEGQTVAGEAPRATTAGVPEIQSNEANVAEIVNEIFVKLLDFAKDELGLSDAQVSFTQQVPATAAQQTVFFAIPNLLRTQSETQNELSQLIESVNVPAEENAKTESILPTSNEIPTEENAQTKTETEDAVKMPTELLETVQHSAPQISNETVVQKSLEQNVHTQISQRVLEAIATMSSDKSSEATLTTFKMTLNPESLGQIEVKIATSDGKVTVEIATQSKQTQSILAERLDGLQAALKQNGVELEKYQVIYAPEQTQSDSRSYEGSSKNPYSKRQSEKNEQNDESIEFSELLKAL